MIKVGIVDAYSTGNQIANRLTAKKIDFFHIQSVDPIPELLKKSFYSSSFDTNIVFDGNWSSLLEKVIEQSPTHIIAGSEVGILLADKLAFKLNLAGNNIFLSEARRNKYLMLNAVRDAGLNAVWQIKENRLEKLLRYLANITFPIVIKPLNSSSGDGFRICHNEYDVREAYQKIMDNKNILGETNKYVLCQPLLKGKEYIINSVSHVGTHYITDVWEMQHRHTENIPMIIDSMTLIPRTDEAWGELVEYTKSVLSALGVRYGAAHTEVMLTDHEVFLIEVNSRLMGGNIDVCFKEALNNYDQIDALVDGIVAPEELKSRLENGYDLEAYIAEVDFIFYKSGILNSFCKEKEIRQLKTFKKFSNMPSIGSMVVKTNSTTNVEGLLYLMDKDYKRVIADRDVVVGWQKNNLIFEVGNVPCQ